MGEVALKNHRITLEIISDRSLKKKNFCSSRLGLQVDEQEEIPCCRGFLIEIRIRKKPIHFSVLRTFEKIEKPTK